MAQIPTIYTGKHQAQPKLGIGAVLAPLAKGVLEETRRRELKRQKDEADFLKMVQVENPFSSVSETTTKEMSALMSDFTDWSTELHAMKDGKLSTEDKLMISNARNKVMGRIGQLEQNEKDIAMGLATAMKDPDTYDLSKAKEAYSNYRKYGDTKGVDPLSFRSVSAAEFYNKNPLQKDFFEIKETAKKVGDKETKIRTTSLDKDAPAFINRIQSDLFSNQGMIKGAIDRFSKLPEKKQLEYMEMAQGNSQVQQDLDGDGDINAMDNAIFLSHRDAVYESLPLTKQTKEDIQSTGGGISIGFGQGRTKGNSFAFSDNVQGVFSEGTGKGLEFTSKSGFKVIGSKLKDESGASVKGIPDTANVIPLRLKNGKLEVEVKYKPKHKEGTEFSLESLQGASGTETKTLYIDYNDVSSKLMAEYPDIKEAIKKYGLTEVKEVKKKTYDPVTGTWK